MISMVPPPPAPVTRTPTDSVLALMFNCFLQFRNQDLLSLGSFACPLIPETLVAAVKDRTNFLESRLFECAARSRILVLDKGNESIHPQPAAGFVCRHL